ncbi:MAG: TIGR00159 family protein [Myxococcales bacterium]|nr:TIGR00159 family protein [Myxococcales bacterium]
MLESIERVFAGRSALEVARDFLDIFIVAYVIYRLLLVVRGTRAMQVGTGLGVVFLLYVAAKYLQLVTLLSLLSYVLSSLILIVVVVFQNDIRRALIRVGGRAWFTGRRKQEQTRVIDEVVAAVTELARHRIGAIIAFEQDANLGDFTQREGVLINAAVTRELLVAIFYPESVNKLHDGAVVIRDLKIARAGVFFPMPEAKEGKVDRSMGTRHQAAIGITEETDAVVVVVSEERGTISFCFNGNIVPNIDATLLRQSLAGLLEQRAAAKAEGKEATVTPVAAPSSGKPGHSISVNPPPAPTSTPIPKVRAEKRASERVLEPAPTPAKGVSTPMPKATKSLLPNPPAGRTSSAPSGDEPPVSERSSFVSPRPNPEEPSERAPRSEEP